jgi:hypothetical protein
MSKLGMVTYFGSTAAFLCSAAIAQEVVDGSPATARQGMHTCPIGLYMTGIDVGNNLFLCASIGGGYQQSQETVDSSSVDFGMHACPNGQVMSGFHEGRNLLLCVPAPTSAVSGRTVDHPGDGGQTVRQGMHACPIGLPMAGIHVGNNYLLCEYPLW